LIVPGIWAANLAQFNPSQTLFDFIYSIMEIYSAVTRIYPITSLVEFCLFCFVINQQLNGIKIQVESLLFVTGINEEDTINEIRDVLFKLQQKHVEISTSLDLLNSCFGLILLIHIPFNFIGVINSTMIYIFSMGNKWDYSTVSIAIDWIQHIVNINLISSSTEGIYSTVKNIKRRMDFCK